MTTRFRSFCLLALLLTAWAAVAARSAAAQTPNPYDPFSLLDAVNVYRQNHTMYAYKADTSLTNSAQAHSVYQASIRSATHTGSGGTTVSQRASSSGYGGGQAVECGENLASGLNLTPDAVIQKWLDGENLANMLSSRFVDAGAGSAVDSAGIVYYTLVFCYIPGQTSPGGSGTSVPGLIDISTPNPDGSIIHIVKPGENLVLIAQAYSVSLSEIFRLNHLTKDSPIYPDQKIKIQLAWTATPTSYFTPSATPFTPEPTSTRRPTRTPKPPITATQPAPTVTPTPAPTGLPMDEVENMWVVSILVLVLAGVILMVSGGLLRLRS